VVVAVVVVVVVEVVVLSGSERRDQTGNSSVYGLITTGYNERSHQWLIIYLQLHVSF